MASDNRNFHLFALEAHSFFPLDTTTDTNNRNINNTDDNTNDFPTMTNPNFQSDDPNAAASASSSSIATANKDLLLQIYSGVNVLNLNNQSLLSTTSSRSLTPNSYQHTNSSNPNPNNSNSIGNSFTPESQVSLSPALMAPLDSDNHSAYGTTTEDDTSTKFNYIRPNTGDSTSTNFHENTSSFQQPSSSLSCSNLELNDNDLIMNFLNNPAGNNQKLTMTATTTTSSDSTSSSPLAFHTASKIQQPDTFNINSTDSFSITTAISPNNRVGISNNNISNINFHHSNGNGGASFAKSDELTFDIDSEFLGVGTGLLNIEESSGPFANNYNKARNNSNLTISEIVRDNDTQMAITEVPVSNASKPKRLDFNNSDALPIREIDEADLVAGSTKLPTSQQAPPAPQVRTNLAFPTHIKAKIMNQQQQQQQQQQQHTMKNKNNPLRIAIDNTQSLFRPGHTRNGSLCSMMGKTSLLSPMSASAVGPKKFSSELTLDIVATRKDFSSNNSLKTPAFQTSVLDFSQLQDLKKKSHHKVQKSGISKSSTNTSHHKKSQSLNSQSFSSLTSLSNQELDKKFVNISRNSLHSLANNNSSSGNINNNVNGHGQYPPITPITAGNTPLATPTSRTIPVLQPQHHNFHGKTLSQMCGNNFSPINNGFQEISIPNEYSTQKVDQKYEKPLAYNDNNNKIGNRSESDSFYASIVATSGDEAANTNEIEPTKSVDSEKCTSQESALQPTITIDKTGTGNSSSSLGKYESFISTDNLFDDKDGIKFDLVSSDDNDEWKTNPFDGNHGLSNSPAEIVDNPDGAVQESGLPDNITINPSKLTSPISRSFTNFFKLKSDSNNLNIGALNNTSFNFNLGDDDLNKILPLATPDDRLYGIPELVRQNQSQSQIHGQSNYQPNYNSIDGNNNTNFNTWKSDKLSDDGFSNSSSDGIDMKFRFELFDNDKFYASDEELINDEARAAVAIDNDDNDNFGIIDIGDIDNDNDDDNEIDSDTPNYKALFQDVSNNINYKIMKSKKLKSNNNTESSNINSGASTNANSNSEILGDSHSHQRKNSLTTKASLKDKLTRKKYHTKHISIDIEPVKKLQSKSSGSSLGGCSLKEKLKSPTGILNKKSKQIQQLSQLQQLQNYAAGGLIAGVNNSNYLRNRAASVNSSLDNLSIVNSLNGGSSIFSSHTGNSSIYSATTNETHPEDSKGRGFISNHKDGAVADNSYNVNNSSSKQGPLQQPPMNKYLGTVIQNTRNENTANIHKKSSSLPVNRFTGAVPNRISPNSSDPTIISQAKPFHTSHSDNTATANNANGHFANMSQQQSMFITAAHTHPEIPVKQPSRRGRKPSTDYDPTKIFSCSLCPRKFKRQEHLKRHFRSLHTGEKPFNCHLCGKNFSRSDNLGQHLKTHGNGFK